MGEFHICHATLPSGGAGGPGGIAEDYLAFWNECCVEELLDRLAHEKVCVILTKGETVGEQELVGALQSASNLSGVLVFGHGHQTKAEIRNRITQPNRVLFEKAHLRTAGRAGVILLAQHSSEQFGPPARAIEVLALIGFAGSPTVPTIGYRRSDQHDSDHRAQIVDFHKIAFVGLVVDLAKVLTNPRPGVAVAFQCSKALETCKQALQEAARQCGELYKTTKNARFSEHQQFLLDNADLLRCTPD